MVKVSLIAAMAENRVIGVNNTMPWHISDDFKHFKALTMGKPMIMGRKTFESLPGVLPGRTHIVVSRSGFKAEGVVSAGALDEAIAIAGEEHAEAFIIGGAQIYTQALEQGLVDTMELTYVHRAYDGDAFFPEWDAARWSETAREDHSEQGEKPAFSFVTLRKI